jgi:UDP-N-acetylmuramate dehydrogenase
MRELVQVPLAPLTTLGLGGRAASFVETTTADELERCVLATGKQAPLFVLGGGSNVVVADAGVSGRVVRVMTSGITVNRVDQESVRLQVQAGESWDALVERCVAEGWSGFESLSGIPGLVGATPIQNVGAYGYEVSNFIENVKVVDRAAQSVVFLGADACGFGYRASMFKRDGGRYVVVSVTFCLPTLAVGAVRYPEVARALGVPLGSDAPLQRIRETVLTLRRQKGMVLDEHDPDTKSAGSFFTNVLVRPDGFADIVARARGSGACGASEEPPHFAHGDRVKVAAAWLIEKSGFARGFRKGNVGISTKHTLALVNRGGTTTELLALAGEIVKKVNDMWGVVLCREPVLVGDFRPGSPGSSP